MDEEEKTHLVRALQAKYAPYYRAQTQRALEALDGLDARKRTRTGAYFVRPGQTTHAECTLADVVRFLDELFDEARDTKAKQRIETASNAVQLLIGLENGLRAALVKHYHLYASERFDAAPDDEMMRGTRLDLDAVVGFLQAIQADADVASSSGDAAEAYLKSANVQVQICNA